jgi:putative transposase
MRSALAKQRVAVSAMLKTTFAQETEAEAVAQWDVVMPCATGSPGSAQADGCLREDVPAYTDFPKEHWPQAPRPTPSRGSTARSGADPTSSGPHDAAIIRLVGALMLETNDERAAARRYMSLEILLV